MEAITTNDGLLQIGTEHTAKNLLTNYSPDILDHWPFVEPDKQPRPDQIKALRAAEKAVREGKKYVIIEAPTGFGKSPVAVAIVSWAKTLRCGAGFEPGGHILSPQKSLTKQYLNDFAKNGLVEIKGKSNYWCETHNTDCDTAAVVNESKNNGDDRQCCDFCPYKEAKKTYIHNPIGTVNFAYYLNETQYAGQLPNRKVMILDEGHNTEGQILGFCDTTITRFRNDEIGLGKVPNFKPGENARCREWLTKTFIPACQQYMTQLSSDVKEAKMAQEREQAVKLAKKLDSYDKFVCRLNRFMNSDDLTNWLCYTTEVDVEDKRTGFKTKENELLIKPLTATLFGEEILFSKAELVVIMSATILDFTTFLRNLGIPRENAVLMAAPCTFPIENRPIFYKPVGAMNMKQREETLPKLAAYVLATMRKYHGKKGIVHTHTYKFTKYIMNYIAKEDPDQYARIINHTSEPGAREAAIERHCESDEATVLFSPSMTEGLDLKDNLSRFQIVCKIPYPYIDPYVEARMNRDPSWYQWLTALVLVQATGRSVRHPKDRAHSYILDADFERFLRLNAKRLPQWWTDAVVI